LATVVFMAAVGCGDNPDGGDAYVFRLDPATGNVVWEHRTTGYTIDPPTAYEGLVFVVGHRELQAVDAETGELRWTRGEANGISQPVPIVDGVLLFAGTPGNNPMNQAPLIALDSDAGAELWEGGCIQWGYGPQVLGAGDGRAYLASTCWQPAAPIETELVAFDAATGAELWSTGNLQHPLSNAVGLGAAPVVESGRVVYPNRDGTLNALDATTGDIAWTTDVSPAPDSPLLFAADGVVFAWQTRDSVLSAVDAATGVERWRFVRAPGDYGALHFTLFNNPLALDGVVYTFASPSEMVALDLETGDELWRVEARAGTMAAGGDVLYLGGNAHMRAFDRHTGTALWEHEYNLDEQTRMQLNFVDGMLLATAWGESPPYRD
jgi:outer membrane protein assembly factor BamB